MQSLRAMAVDDSPIYRRVVGQALAGVRGVELVGTAAHGKEALSLLQRTPADLITLDLEMPEMDGVSTLKALRASHFRGRVIVLSAMSRAGADATIRAMAAGADDFLLKPSAKDASEASLSAAELVRQALLPKLQQFFGWLGEPAAVNLRPAAAAPAASASASLRPVALEAPLRCLIPLTGLPLIVAQHMPALFTASLATHLRGATGASVQEAQDGQKPEAGSVYLAPGDFHLRLMRCGPGAVEMRLGQEEKRNFVRPSADFLFETAARVYGRHSLGIVLTGMGSDGRDGALALKQAGGKVLIQNRASCAVFGMPKAVQDAGAADMEADPAGLASLVHDMVQKAG